MFNTLKEIVNYTLAVDLDLVRISGTEQQTVMQSVSADKSIVLEARFNQPVPEFASVLGLPNLGRLNVILNIPEYREDPQVTLTSNSEKTLESISFANKTGDFHNTYRLMDTAMINSKIAAVSFKEPKWNVAFEPLAVNIQRLRYQSQALSDQIHCHTYTQSGNLMLEVGDPSSLQGKFVFHPNVTGQLQKKMTWVTKHLINILGLTGDKQISISDAGAMQITVNSGVATYNYILLAQTK